jgi:hypothetical protein
LTPLTELQERYARALVQAWERADRATTSALMEQFDVSVKTVFEHLRALEKRGFAHRAHNRQWMPTLLAIEAYGTVWVRRERQIPEAQRHMSVGWNAHHVALNVPGMVLKLEQEQAAELRANLTDAITNHIRAREELARQMPN